METHAKSNPFLKTLLASSVLLLASTFTVTPSHAATAVGYQPGGPEATQLAWRRGWHRGWHRGGWHRRHWGWHHRWYWRRW